MPYLLDENKLVFPHPSLADEDGLLAIGADLQLERLLLAYENGIFPWYNEENPILWFAPLERFVLVPNKIKLSKSMKQIMKSNKFKITIDQDFKSVIENCASMPRKDQDGTWIIADMQEAYIRLHEAGYAHSIEVWQDQKLVGGLYGVQVGKVFCGESMFSMVSNASKIALIYLAQNFGLSLIDCQIPSDHLSSMGAETISQSEYLTILHNQEILPYEFQRTL
ncbi:MULTISPECIES: leucyl/phenylalanyl-tRNA--protein transferase [Sphingobacterium]|uniref:Leucyl/phenylalanyl-tRNA--protein transferase n=1 Tax=Sphingobacterium cellulitidis TaxID=1768011 RepID=A0A8H9KU29_9SPHI|nr:MULTISPECIES: leucyl/phenylalanyl-tRNA--protein transferase [Sphingobacterium]MBA8985649.1 leucyl/phenylalanyl-tRNA--protein transferase [Sphingobacterium soli]WFB64066.1 leucyl/phenylalanyl-tRNA--protein transferase [Sphingobacterium sp. WM]GGE07972.1 leucyl/phenylalanyl-tRNA--protein transferase [Sphingobacterium soli]